MTQSHQRRRPGPGRPRHIDKPGAATERARDEVLDAAARLFTDRGYANTSTRQIAEAVGIRQASLYYHFAGGKGDMLTEVLALTVRPTLENIDVVADLADDPATALYLLVLLDVQTLANAPHNSGRLAMFPDVVKEVPEFSTAHSALAIEYGRIGARLAPLPVAEAVSQRQLGGMLLQNVESVIGWIGDGVFTMASADVVASTCLRICGVDEDMITTARIAAHERLAEVTAEVA